MKKQILEATNTVLKPLGAAILPEWQYTGPEEYVKRYPTFDFDGRTYPFYLHHDNCGHYPPTASERTVELALADHWLGQRDRGRVVEVGAVSPYYWPGRVARVVDPADTHPLVSDRATVADVDLRGADVLCISTLEHVGQSEYGLEAAEGLLEQAVAKILAESASFLITVPTGYSPAMDRVIFERPFPGDVRRGFLVRCRDTFHHPYWSEAHDPAVARCPYGDRKADAVAIFRRGADARAAT